MGQCCYAVATFLTLIFGKKMNMLVFYFYKRDTSIPDFQKYALLKPKCFNYIIIITELITQRHHRIN